MNFYTPYLFFILFLTFLQNSTAGGDPLKDFEKWELQYFNQSYLNCSDGQVSLYDEFDGDTLSDVWQTHLYGPKEDGLYCRLHTNDAEEIFMRDNVRVEMGLLKLTARWEAVEWKGVKRGISSGLVQSKNGFNLGRYEIRCKMPPQPHVWTAFWVWSIEEIDFIDVATKNYYSNAMHGNGYSQSQMERNFPVDLSKDFHTYACEWTPFKVDYFFDGQKTATFHRFYKPDKTPLDIDCGDEIPQGVYKINPAFPKLSRQFKPIAWIAIEKACWHGDCDCDDDKDPNTHCGPKIDQKDLPSTFEVDYIKVEEKAYDLVSIIPGCFYASKTKKQESCLDLTVQTNNYKLAKSQYKLINWELSDNVKILEEYANKVCFQYEKPLEEANTYTHWIIKNNIVIDLIEIPFTKSESAILITANVQDQDHQFTISMKQYACLPENPGLITKDIWKIIRAMIF